MKYQGFRPFADLFRLDWGWIVASCDRFKGLIEEHGVLPQSLRGVGDLIPQVENLGPSKMMGRSPSGNRLGMVTWRATGNLLLNAEPEPCKGEPGAFQKKRTEVHKR